MKTYRYTDESNSVVAVYDEDGASRSSRLASEVPAGSDILQALEPDPAAAALSEIISLEIAAQVASQRLYREAILATMETQAKAANITLEQLAAKNKGYRELKAFNTQIEALREILKGTT